MEAANLNHIFATATAGAPVTIAKGQIRTNTITGKIEVHNGSNWIEFGSIEWNRWDLYDTNVLTDDELCERHPGLQELRDQVKEAQQKYDAFKALCQENKQ